MDAAAQASSEPGAAAQKSPGTEASESSVGSSGSAGAPPAFGQTASERGQALDQTLDRSLADFDERLRREQVQLDAMRQAQAQMDEGAVAVMTGGGAGAGSAGMLAGGLPQVDDAGGSAGDPLSGGQTGSGIGDQPDIAHDSEGRGDGRDDDIVARQLRQAAESETDPRLREKLWEEYRSYTQGQRR